MVSRRYRKNTSINTQFGGIESRVSDVEKRAKKPKAADVEEGAIAPDAVDNTAIQPNAVNEESIQRGSVGTEHLGVVNQITADSRLTLSTPLGVRLDSGSLTAPSPGVYSQLVIDSNKDVSVVADEVAFGAVAGVDSTGVTVTLTVGGTVTAIYRNPKYYPVVGDNVLMQRHGTTYYIVSVVKIAGSVRADIALTTNWTRYNTEAQTWNGPDGGNWGPPHAYKMTNGVVKLGGLIRKWQGGAFSSGEKIGTIPAGYFPDYNCVFTLRADTGAARIVIDSSDGSIYALDGGSGFISLDNASYIIGATWTPATLLNSWAAHTSWAAVGAQPALTLPVPGYTKDSNGIVWTRGAALRASDPTTDTAIFTYPSTYGPISSYRNHMRSAGHTASTFGYTTIGVAGSTNRDRRWQSPCSRGVLFDGTPFVSESSTLMPYAATAAVPAPVIPDGSTTYSSGANWIPRLYVTPEGFCLLHGLAALASLTTFGWVPPEVRPRYRRLFEAVTTGAAGRLDIYTNGRTLAVTGTIGWAALDAMSWIADAGEVDQADGGA